jgi:hypothetical protein
LYETKDANEKSGAMEITDATHVHELNDRSGSVPDERIGHFSRNVYTFSGGEAGLHHALCVHRSLPNHSPYQRRAIIVRFMPKTPSIQSALELCDRDAKPIVQAGKSFSWVELPAIATKNCNKNTPLMLVKK